MIYFPYNGPSYWITLRALLIGIRSRMVLNGPCKQGYEGAMIGTCITAFCWVGLFHQKRKIIEKRSCQSKNSKVLMVTPGLHSKFT